MIFCCVQAFPIWTRSIYRPGDMPETSMRKTAEPGCQILACFPAAVHSSILSIADPAVSTSMYSYAVFGPTRTSGFTFPSFPAPGSSLAKANCRIHESK